MPKKKRGRKTSICEACRRNKSKRRCTHGQVTSGIRKSSRNRVKPGPSFHRHVVDDMGNVVVEKSTTSETLWNWEISNAKRKEKLNDMQENDMDVDEKVSLHA